MTRRSLLATGTALAGAAATVAALTTAPAGATSPSRLGHAPSSHVLLLSVDGLHAGDLDYWVTRHPHSALAGLVRRGTDYSAARTTFPSDSFPGMVAQLTGGGPGTTGVYYDDTYDRRLLPASTTDCALATPGAEVSWTEAADRSQNPLTLDAGQGLDAPALTALPSNTRDQTLADRAAITRAILHLTPHPQTLLDPAALPVSPKTCRPVYPHDWLRTNTVFDVAHRAGLRTAWSDKHPAYEILDGPRGTGLDDLFTPEINSVADADGDDWTTDNALTREYDGTKVAAVLNEIDGYDHSRTSRVGTPAVFGMNFQSVSTAQKLPTSDGLVGGYTAAGTPGPLLQVALRYVDGAVAAFERRLARDGLQDSTTIILSAKHGQSPTDPAALRRVDDGAIVDGLDAAWAAGHPGAAPLVSFSVDDDAMLLWLADRSRAAQDFARHYLLTHSAPANLISDPKGTYSTTVASSGLTRVCTGAAADRLFGARTGDAHAPDLVGLAQYGVVYTGGVKKIAEHGGDAPADRNVALVVSGAGVARGRTVSRPVQTTQIAPTILELLGLDPSALQAVRSEGTRVLPRR